MNDLVDDIMNMKERNGFNNTNNYSSKKSIELKGRISDNVSCD
jgi:hypothetical protein